MFLDKRVFALVAMSYQSCRHCFFNNVSEGDLAVFLEFFATKGDVGFLFAKSAARFAALCVLATKLFVDLYRRALHLEVAEWALGEKVQPCGCKVLPLLQMLQSLKSLFAQDLL